MTAWIPIETRKPTEEDAYRGQILVQTFSGAVESCLWNSLQARGELYNKQSNAEFWQPLPPPFVPEPPKVRTEYRRIDFRTDIGRAVECSFDGVFEGTKLRRAFLVGRTYKDKFVVQCEGNDYLEVCEFCRIPVAEDKPLEQAVSPLPEGEEWRDATAEDIGKPCRVRDNVEQPWRYREEFRSIDDLGWFGSVTLDQAGTCFWKFCQVQSAPQPESRPTNETPEVDWSKVPEGCDWAAMDADGEWCAYDFEPTAGTNCWWRSKQNSKRVVINPKSPYIRPGWISSLQQRPRPVEADPTKEYGDYKCGHGVPSKTCSICSNTSVSEKILNHADQLKKTQWRVATSSDIGAQFEFIRVRDAAYKKDTWSSFGGAVLDHITENGKFCIVYEDKEWIWDECEVLVSATARRTPTKEDLDNAGGRLNCWVRDAEDGVHSHWVHRILINIDHTRGYRPFIVSDISGGQVSFNYCEIESLSVQPAANNGVME